MINNEGRAKRFLRQKKDKQVSIVITSALESLSLEQRGRQRRYFVSMMVRTACFIATIFLPSPARWVTLGGAVILPYIAVVMANAGREDVSGPNSLIKGRHKEIEKG